MTTRQWKCHHRSPGMTMTLKGMRSSLVGVPSLCVPMITLYEYFTACPRNDGGASVGIASSNLTEDGQSNKVIKYCEEIITWIHKCLIIM